MLFSVTAGLGGGGTIKLGKAVYFLGWGGRFGGIRETSTIHPKGTLLF